MSPETGTETALEHIGIRAFPGRIIVQEDRPLEKIGRIVIPEKHQTRPTMGVVVHVGTGTATAAKPGDRIVYPRWSGTGIQIKGRTNAYRALSPEECLCFVDEGVDIDETGA